MHNMNKVFHVSNLPLFSVASLKVLLSEDWINVPEDEIVTFNVNLFYKGRC